MDIRDHLENPHGVLNWDSNAVDPCSWTMVTCSADKLVIGLGAPSQSLAGSLSPGFRNLTYLQILTSGGFRSFKLDLSNNFFSGEIPSSLSHLKSLQYLRLNNNSFHGAIPSSLANMTQLAFLAKSAFENIQGFFPGGGVDTTSRSSLTSTSNIMRSVTWKLEEVSIQRASDGHKQFQQQEHNREGWFWDCGQRVFERWDCCSREKAQRWERDWREDSVQTEVEMISLAIHQNLLRLYSFCAMAMERVLVYPYTSKMPASPRVSKVKQPSRFLFFVPHGLA
ncbi:NSP-interacting kinase 1 [Actinidia rufa]|uniref:NSP-interacting kinase 1 n=1 Tax=Actinidia rufa TaxID=165716 RepID=A0A7J0HEN0_9ERIC|nr:NSP-interacting kinase 1 [Actinidia rufa]